ncbi:MAG: hypothetical protein PG981_000314 [Wolbachia endosymbiont of Ctenocephalides orientis wCori]|nr:MAG: hypothetical protein PG981_000314 [Wolbachia endosymbiont of Ctenocephalides orientis wCori]
MLSFSIQLGKKIKRFRLLRGLNQTQLGEKVGVTYTQIQRYENGSNQVLISRLCELAKALSVDILSFFTDVHIEPTDSWDEESEDVLKEYSKIKSKKSRDFVYSLTKFLSQFS